MENFQKSRNGFLNPFFIPPFNRRTERNAFIDLFKTVGLLELVMEGLGQVIGDEAVIAG